MFLYLIPFQRKTQREGKQIICQVRFVILLPDEFMTNLPKKKTAICLIWEPVTGFLPPKPVFSPLEEKNLANWSKIIL